MKVHGTHTLTTTKTQHESNSVVLQVVGKLWI